MIRELLDKLALKRLQKRAIEQGTGANISQWLELLLSGAKTSSGVVMNEDKALTIGAVYTSVRIISGTLASLPLHVYRRNQDGGRDLALTHWAYPMLHDAPNEYHSAFTWLELLLAHLLLWGNSYNRIEWLNSGKGSALYPLMPWTVQPRMTSGGTKYYTVQLPDGREDLPDDEMLHVPGLSYDGMSGMSVIGKMRDSLGIHKAADNLAGAFFGNGAKVGHILEIPGRMDPEAQKNLVNSLAQKFTNPEEAFKTLVLEEGAKLHGSLMMPLQDAQFFETRKFQRSEIFGWFGVPPHLAGDTERSTSWGTGIEQQDIGYAKHTITPICRRIEKEVDRKLFVRGSGFYAKFNIEGLMRGDFKTRMEGLQIAVGRPWLTGNEARDLDDWNRSTQEGMDDVALPLNMAGAADDDPPPDPAPGAPAATAEGGNPADTDPVAGKQPRARAARTKRRLLS